MKPRTRLMILGTLTSVLFLLCPLTVQARPLGMDGLPIVSPPSRPQTMTVASGDTLSGLAALINETWMNLAAFNHLSDPNLLTVGQTLVVPPQGWKAPTPAYVVSKPVETRTAPARAAPTAPTAPVNMASVWHCIGHYESGNNPSENTGNGYFGEWQFLPRTWQTMMSQMYGAPTKTFTPPYYSYPYAAGAPEGTQLAAAERLEAEVGWGQWPQTSKKCGM